MSPLAGILRTELIEAAGQRFGLSPPEAVTPLGTEDRTPCFTARETRSVPGIPRLARPARKGGCGDLQDARTRYVTPPSLCVVYDARAQGAHP
jgi:hypothetical protein